MSINPLAALPAVVPAVLILLCAAQAQEDEPPQSLPLGGVITHTGHAGVVIDYGETTVMIDALHDGGPGEEDAQMRAAMLAGQAPFDGVSDVFVTHADRDHYSATALTDWLRAHPGAYALVPSDLRVTGPDKEMPAQDVLTRVVPLAGRDYEASPVSHGPKFSWAFLQIPHDGRQHLAYWLAIPPREMTLAEARETGVTAQHLTVLHLGDTDDYPEDLEPFAGFFAAHASDVALVPFAMLGEEGLAEMLNARELIGIDVPAEGASMLDARTLNWLAEPGEQRIVYKNMEE